MQSFRLLALSLTVPLVTLLATTGFMSIPPDTRGIDLVAGGDLFRTHCAACHFDKVGFPAHNGPNLHDIGKFAATRKANQSAAEYILESILDPAVFVAPGGRPGMPPNLATDLDPEELRNLVGYLASRGAFPDYEEIAKLDIPDRRGQTSEAILVRREEMQLAEHVLREKGSCLNCHSLYSVPEGQAFAPPLFGAGLRDSKAIYQSLVNPHQEIKPRYKSVNVVLTDGTIVSGQLISRSDEQLVLRSSDAKNKIDFHEIPLADVETEDGQPMIVESKTSMMPEGFDKSLSRAEIDAVIKLIQQLN